MLHLRAFSLLLFLFTLCVGTIGAAESGGQYDVELIKNAGLEATRASFEKYLRGLHPNEAVHTRVGQLIKQLDSDSFREREDATNQLEAMPELPREAVREAAQSDSPETRFRAQQVLEKYRTTQVTRSGTLYSVFKVIQYGRVDVPLFTILETVPQCDRRSVVTAALAAAKKVCKPTDEATLRQYLTNSMPSLRGAACEVLGDLMQSQGKPTDPAIVAMLLTDHDERARVSAARAVANRGDRRCLSVLVGLLHAESQDVRTTAINTLRSATGQRFAYAAYDDRARRNGAVSRWQQWLKEHGDAAKLNFPLKADEHQWGRILVCVVNPYRIVEFDSSRNIIWNKEDIKHPCACVGTPSGERIVVHGKRIVTYDATGKEVRKTDRMTRGDPKCLVRTPEGNLIIGISSMIKRTSGGRFVDLGGDVETIRQFDVSDDAPYDLQVLPNGNLLFPIRQHGKVVECDREGKEIWKLSCPGHPVSGSPYPHSARRLPNGNTLLSYHGTNRVVEFDRDNKEVWSTKVAERPVRAIALENGNILVGHVYGISEINRRGEEVWSKQLGEVADIALY